MTMAGKGLCVLVTPTSDLGKIVACMHRLDVVGECNLTAGIQVAQLANLALKHCQNKKQQLRIIVFSSCLRKALQLLVQDSAKDQGSETDMSKLLSDQSFVSSILGSLRGVDPNDPSVKDLLASMQSQPESEQKKDEDKTPNGEEKK